MKSKQKVDALLAIFFVLLVLGFLLHQSQTFAGSLPGHILGIAGAVIIGLALVYPIRKRIFGKKGKANPLNRHIIYGLTGASLGTVHSAHKFSSAIGALTFLALLLVVLSGIVGRFLYRNVNRQLREQKKDLNLLKNHFKAMKQHIADCLLETGRHIEEDDAVKRNCREILDQAYGIAELEMSINVFEKTKALFSKWLHVHYMLTFFLVTMLVVHILAAIYYGLRWIP